MSREQFELYYSREQLPCLSSVKERHWQTWLEAQATLLSAHGPVTILCVPTVNADDLLTMRPGAVRYVDTGGGFQRANSQELFAEREKQIVEEEIRQGADESYSKGWKDCMEIAKK